MDLQATRMPPGAFGARAGELLESFASNRGLRIHRVGGVAMLDPPHIEMGARCCWLFGEPEGLEALSARFGRESNDDLTSTFARAVAELGEGACELLCGRFVAVTVDRKRDSCVVTRDQLGTQPLVHMQLGEGVLFGEHECDLLGLLSSSPSPDRLALLQWIDSGLHPAGRTLYEGLQRLGAGHRLTIGKGQPVQVERWWSARYVGTRKEAREALAGYVQESAFAAVERAAAGSKRPAVKLSGGLDSACVAAGLSGGGFADGRGLAIGGTFSGHPETDESELIEATATHTRLPLERVPFEPASSMLAPALAHIARWRLPPATPNIFLWQPVMARARALGVDVMLDGEGGDELFGFAPYLIADRVRAGHLHSAWSLAGRMPGMGLHPDSRMRRSVLRRFGLGPLLPETLRRRREARSGTRSIGAIVPRTDAQTLAELSLAAQRDRSDGPLWWRFQVQSLIDQRDALDMGGHYRRQNADDEMDRRHPFLNDLQLIEAMLQLPPEAQFDPIRDRVLLREGLTGLIPESVRTRHEKSHFTPLVLAGVRADEAGLIEPLRQARAPVRAYVATEALDRKIGVPPDRRSMLDAGSLWRVGIANRWLDSLARAGS